MTANQLAYQQMLTQRRNVAEQERTNRVKEKETQRHNQADEYNSLIRSLNNIFSLIAHGAGGNPSIIKGLANLYDNVTKIDNIDDLRGIVGSQGVQVIDSIQSLKSDYDKYGAGLPQGSSIRTDNPSNKPNSIYA